jgi:hypothetical protein
MIDVPAAGCEEMATDVTCNNKKRKQVTATVVVGANKKKRKRQEAMEAGQESIINKVKRIFAE